MKQVEFPEFKDYTGQEVHYLQPKRDGHLCKIFIDQGEIQALTKNNKDKTAKLLKIKHIADELSGLVNLTGNTVLFGELYSPGIPASSVPTLLNNTDERLLFTAFAVPWFNGEDWSNSDLIVAMQLLEKFGVSTVPTTRLPENIVDEEDIKTLLEMAVKNKQEGWVLKEGHMAGWYKLKPVKTVDAFVIDTYASDSKRYKGGLKCIRIAVWDKEGKVRDLGTAGNGFKLPYRLRFVPKEKMDILLGIDWLETDEKNFQEHLTVACLAGLINRDTLLNQVCEITYDSVAAGGKLRFPRFSRWRDDKDIKDCTEDQLGE